MSRTINYSVSLRKKPGDDVAAPKAYAQAQSKGTTDIEELSEKISQATTMTRGDVKGVLASLEDEIIDRLLNGEIVKLGDLGTFRVSLQSTGAESMEAFTAANIKKANVVFRPSTRMQIQMGKASYSVVAPTYAVDATLKAIKSGSTVVDLEAAQQAQQDDDGTGE